MAVTVQCPNLVCRAILQIPEEVRGKKVRCGKCGVCFIVPPGRPAVAAQPAKPAESPEKRK